MNIQSKFGDIRIIISRDTLDKADTAPFGEAQIFTIFGFGKDPNINQKKWLCSKIFLYNHPFQKLDILKL